jgi:type I restriction enzyme, S subunit
VSIDLPQGWAFVTPDQLAAHTPNALTIGPFGSDLKVSDYRTNGVPLVFVREIRAGSFGDKKTKCIDEVKAVQLARHTVRGGDLLITKMGDPPGDTAVYPETRPNGIITADCIKLTPNIQATSSAYLNLCFRAESVRSEVLENTAGVAQQKLSLERFRTVRLPLPPLNEQRRIVAKLEDLLARSRRAKDALDAIPPLLEKLRQSILAAAFRGDLTADWRAKNPNVEPAEELLKRIRIERRKKWEETELAKLRAKGKAPTDDRWKAKYKEPEPVDASDLPELPEGWCWATLDAVAYDGPSNGFSPKADAAEGGTLTLKLSATSSGRVVLNAQTTKRIPEPIAATSELWLKPGDLLIQRANTLEYVGTPAVFDGPADTYVYPDLMMRVRAVPSIGGRWLCHMISTTFVRSYLRERATGTAGNMPKINGQTVRSAPIPVPPPTERLQIEQRLAAHDVSNEALGSLLANATQASDTLARSLLAKAFRGELVDQDPNDEPASAMLERLAAERQAALETPAAPKRSPRQKARA